MGEQKLNKNRGKANKIFKNWILRNGNEGQHILLGIKVAGSLQINCSGYRADKRTALKINPLAHLYVLTFGLSIFISTTFLASFSALTYASSASFRGVPSAYVSVYVLSAPVPLRFIPKSTAMHLSNGYITYGGGVFLSFSQSCRVLRGI